MNIRLRILLLLTVIQSTLTQLSYNIYPVAGEVFQKDIAQLFGVNNVPSSVWIANSSQTNNPFTVTNYGTVINNNVIINGTIISTSLAPQFGNPNIPDYRYCYLVEVYSDTNQFVGYQLYEGTLYSNGTINPIPISQIFNPPNTTCYTVEYLSLPEYKNSLAAAICLSNVQHGWSSIGVYYPIDQYLLFMPENYVNDFTLSSVSQLTTQITVSEYGQTYLTVLYNMINSGNIISLFQIITNEQIPYLQYLQQGLSYDYKVVSFYLATDLTLFLLQNNSIVAVNATDYSFDLIDKSPLYPYNQMSMGVYQTATNAVNQIFYIAVSNPSIVTYLEYQKGNFIIKTFFQTYCQVQNIFLSTLTSVFTSQNCSFSNSKLEVNVYSKLWSEVLINQTQQTFAAFDNYNNVLVWALNNGTILTVQFRQQQLITPVPLDFSTPNGNFTIVGLVQSQQIKININYTVVSNSNLAQIYQKQQIILPQLLFPGGKIHPTKYFIGPNLNYTTSVVLESNVFKQTSFFWIIQDTLYTPQNCTFVQNIKANQALIIQIYQVNNNGQIQTFAQNCQVLYSFCVEPVYIPYLDQQIQQIYVTQLNNFLYTLAIQYQSPSTKVTVIQTPSLLNIYEWTVQVTVDITKFFNASGLTPTIKSIANLYNNLYIVTQNPSSLIAVQISDNQYYQIASTQLTNYAPQNVWVNQKEFGEYIFVDNVYELVILQLVNQTFFAELNTIEYPIQSYDTLIFGLLDYGIFLTFLNNQESNIYFYPLNNIQVISFTQEGYTTTPGTYNYTINQTISTSSQLFQYFLDEDTLLVYQYAESSVGTLFTTYKFQSPIQSITAVSNVQIYVHEQEAAYLTELITVIINGTTLSLSLPYSPQFETNLLTNNQYLIQNGEFFLNISSNGYIQQEYSFETSVFSTEQNLTITANQSATNQYYSLNTTNTDQILYFNTLYYPYPDFLGPISYISAKFIQNDSNTISISNPMVKGYRVNSVYNFYAFYYSQQVGVVAQNNIGVFILNTNYPEYITNTLLFPFPSVTTFCPVVGQYNSTLFLSVCSLTNSSNVIYLYNQTQNYSYITLINVTGTLGSGFYQNGIFTLSSQTNAFVCILNLQTQQQIYCQQALEFDSTITNYQSLELIQIYNSNTSFSQSFGIIIPQDEYFQFIIVGVNDQTNLSISNELQADFTFINSTQSLFNQLEKIYISYVQENIGLILLYQLLQTSNATTIGSQVQVPVFFAITNVNLGLNIYFNVSEPLSPTIINIILQCGYGTYTGTYFGTTALNDLIVTSYTDAKYVSYLVYRSSNPLFGGDGSPVCIPQEPNIQMIYNLGSFTGYYGLESAYSYPYTFVLQNGQVFSTIQNFQTQMIQLSPGYQVSGYLLSQNIYSGEVFPVQVYASNDYFGISNVLNIQVFQNIIPNPKPSQNDSSLLWIIIGSFIGGLIVFGVIAWFIYKKKYQGDQDLYRNIEL